MIGKRFKICIALDGLRGEESIAELCRREGITTSLLLQRLQGIPRGRQAQAGWRHRAKATGPEAKELRAEATDLKGALADVMLENRLLKKA